MEVSWESLDIWHFCMVLSKVCEAYPACLTIGSYILLLRLPYAHCPAVGLSQLRLYTIMIIFLINQSHLNFIYHVNRIFMKPDDVAKSIDEVCYCSCVYSDTGISRDQNTSSSYGSLSFTQFPKQADLKWQVSIYIGTRDISVMINIVQQINYHAHIIFLCMQTLFYEKIQYLRLKNLKIVSHTDNWVKKSHRGEYRKNLRISQILNNEFFFLNSYKRYYSAKVRNHNNYK